MIVPASALPLMALAMDLSCRNSQTLQTKLSKHRGTIGRFFPTAGRTHPTVGTAQTTNTQPVSYVYKE